MRKFKIVLCLVWVWVLLISLPGSVLGLPLEEIISRVQDVYQRIEDLKADFVQNSTLVSLNKTQTAKGKLYFKNPGKLRWDYIDPTKQEIVTDGETLWMYMSEDRQVIVSEFSKVYPSNTSAFFLSGMGNIRRDFTVEQVAPTNEDGEKGYLLRLIPKEEQSNVDELFLWIDKGSFLVVETYFHDFYGNLIRIKFENHVINRGLPDSIFVFTIPKDVEVVDPAHLFPGQ